MSKSSSGAYLEQMGKSGMGSTVAPEHGVDSHDIGEGPLARIIEEQTAKLPSDVWLWAAMGSIAASLYLQSTHHRQRALFVGQWAPTFLILGLYNKLVKVNGSD
jgi:hypothetical protein